MAHAVDLEEDLVLALAQDLLVIDAPGSVDRAIQPDPLFAGEGGGNGSLDGAVSHRYSYRQGRSMAQSSTQPLGPNSSGNISQTITT